MRRSLLGTAVWYPDDRGHRPGLLTVHPGGYDIVPMPAGKTRASPGKGISCLSDDGKLTGLRYDDRKLIFIA